MYFHWILLVTPWEVWMYWVCSCLLFKKMGIGAVGRGPVGIREGEDEGWAESCLEGRRTNGKAVFLFFVFYCAQLANEMIPTG